MNPHQHRWSMTGSKVVDTGERVTTRRCLDCGKTERVNELKSMWGIPDEVAADPTITRRGPIEDERAVAYDESTEEFFTNRGRKLTKGAVLKANLGLTESELDRMLRSIGGVSKAMSASTAAASKAFTDMNDLLSTPFPETRPQRRWTSEDALELILREIKKDPSKAGEWITRFTNGVIEITREEDDDAE